MAVKYNVLSRIEDLIALDRIEKAIQEARKLFMPADCLYISGLLAYSGPFDLNYRRKIEASFKTNFKKLGMKISDNITMSNFLADQLEIMNWNMKGLPKDETSIQNGIIIFYNTRWP